VIAAALIAIVTTMAIGGATPPRPTADRFDEHAAWSLLVRQVRLGPRPAGSPASRRLAGELRAAMPRGAFQNVPGGLRNVVGFVRGRDPSRYVVLGAHYDTKDIPGFGGADDGAAGTAIVTELARTIRPRELRPSVLFILFDGEEAPAGASDQEFASRGLRGSRVAAPVYRKARAMILVDLVAGRDVELTRERSSDATLWRRVRAAAARIGEARLFPAKTVSAVIDDHSPFLDEGVPAVDLVDLGYRCWHRKCDNLSSVSIRSLDAVGETVYELLCAF
jgi:glutaminyl-peptide cyclotransferase